MLWQSVIKSWNFGGVCCQRTILTSVRGGLIACQKLGCNACSGRSMFAVSEQYIELGRLRDALRLQERALEFLRRGLPEHHPEIGEFHGWLPGCMFAFDAFRLL